MAHSRHKIKVDFVSCSKYDVSSKQHKDVTHAVRGFIVMHMLLMTTLKMFDSKELLDILEVAKYYYSNTWLYNW